MSSPPQLTEVTNQAGPKPRHRKLSIVGSLRNKTSRIFHRKSAATTDITTASTADNTAQVTQPQPPKANRRWFHTVGARFHRHDQPIIESSESVQDVRVEQVKTSEPACPPSSPESRSSQSSERRRLLSPARFRLHSLPGKLRRRKPIPFSETLSQSDEDKENVTALNAPQVVHASNAGSWSSFRSSLQRAVQGM